MIELRVRSLPLVLSFIRSSSDSATGSPSWRELLSGHLPQQRPAALTKCPDSRYLLRPEPAMIRIVTALTIVLWIASEHG